MKAIRNTVGKTIAKAGSFFCVEFKWIVIINASYTNRAVRINISEQN